MHGNCTIKKQLLEIASILFPQTKVQFIFFLALWGHTHKPDLALILHSNVLHNFVFLKGGVHFREAFIWYLTSQSIWPQYYG